MAKRSMALASTKDDGTPNLAGMISDAMAANIAKQFEVYAGMVTTPDKVLEENIGKGLKRAKLIYDMMMRNKDQL